MSLFLTRRGFVPWRTKTHRQHTWLISASLPRQKRKHQSLSRLTLETPWDLETPRETEPIGCVRTGRFYFKELAHMIMEAAKLNAAGGRASWRARGKSQVAVQVRACLLRPWTDWMRPTYFTEGNLLYSVSTESNVHLISNTETSSQKELQKCLTKYLGTTALLSWHIKLTITHSWISSSTVKIISFRARWNVQTLNLQFIKVLWKFWEFSKPYL